MSSAPTTHVQYKPSPVTGSCLPTAFAYVIGADPSNIVAAIGHSGQEVINDEDPPRCLKGFHIDELTDLLLNLGYAVVTINACPNLVHSEGSIPIYTDERVQDRLDFYMDNYTCVIGGKARSARHRHALAWIDGKAYDPDTGRETTLDNFVISALYLVGN